MTFFLALIVFIFLFAGNAPARADRELGRQAYDQQKENHEKAMKECAQRENCFYERTTSIPTLNINTNFYPDGSLKRDAETGKLYPKGQYYVDRHGLNARRDRDYSKPRPQ